jgi:RNA polymerase sigma factor (sigma-70 family)
VLDGELVTLVKSCLAKPKGGASREEDLACEQLFASCVPIIRAKMWCIDRDQFELDDFIQDVLVLLVRKLPELPFDPSRAPLAAWVTRIAARQAKKATRRRRKRRPESLSEMQAATLVDPEPTPDVELEGMQDHELFRELVAKFAATLSERNRRIVILHWVEAWSLSTIASDLHLTPDTVWGVYRLVHGRLSDYLRRNGLGPT